MDTTTTAAHSSAPASQPQRANWAGVVSLGVGILAIVMSEFLPTSLLPRIAADLAVTAGAAGQSVTVTAIASALAALCISVVLPRADRRRVIATLSILAVLSNLIVALAPNLGILLAARVLLGIALGGFWVMAITVATKLVPSDRVGRALTVVNAGVAVAAVIAVPLGAWLGETWGWRIVFMLAAVLGVLALVLQLATLPSVAAERTGGLRAFGQTLRRGVVVLGLGATLLIAGGHYLGFTYIRPIVEDVAGSGAGDIALLLLVFGTANIVGTALAGPLADRSMRAGLLLYPVVLGGGMLLMLDAGSSGWLLFTVALWGFGMGGVPTIMQIWGARTEPERLEQISGMLVVMFSVAIAGGALLGGVLLDTVSAVVLLPVAGISVIVGGLLIAFFGIRGAGA